MQIKEVRNICYSALGRTYEADVEGGSGNYQYQWRWLIDTQNSTYFPYVTAGKSINFPYAISMCDENRFNKVWNGEVKVIDMVTGETKNTSFGLTSEYCRFGINDRNWGDIGVSTCFNDCQTETTFQVYTKDPNRPGDYKYEYIYRNPTTGDTSEWIDVTATDGKFCPEIFMYPWTSCESGYIEHIQLGYRITDLHTGEVGSTGGITRFFYLECFEPNNDYPYPESNTMESSENKNINKNTVIIKDTQGNIITVKPIDDNENYNN